MACQPHILTDQADVDCQVSHLTSQADVDG